MRNSFYLIISLFLFNSCAYHSGMMTGNASITNGNFKIVETAIGTSETIHILGIGGLNKDAIVFDAKKDLLRRYPLKRGQALANVTVDFKRTWVLFVVTNRVTLTADVVDFNVDVKETEFDNIYSKNMTSNNVSLGNFKIGDSVLVMLEGKPKRAQISSVNSLNVTTVYRGVNEEEFSSEFGLESVYKMESDPDNLELYGFDVGEKVKAKDWRNNPVEGVIFGINSYQAGIKYDFKEDKSFSWLMIDLNRLKKLK